MTEEEEYEYDNLFQKLAYAYRVIDYGFTHGNFDFSILKDEAAQFVRLNDNKE